MGILTFRCDHEGDILTIATCVPYAEQDSVELGDGVIARLSPTTGHVESIEILFFSKRLSSGEPLQLPITADLRVQTGN